MRRPSSDGIATPSRPSLVAHADWSTSPAKRWLATAVERGGRYEALGPEPVGNPSTLLARLRDRAGADACVLVGFDFPIGLPEAYASAAGIESFPDALVAFDERFYSVAEHAREISLARPFYPRRPGGTTRTHLVEGLGVDSFDRLLRRCERPSGSRRAACALFWTLGGQQVGKAAITGWRDVLAPGRRVDLALWPFDGSLDSLLAPRRTVVVETYPTEVYAHLGVSLGGSKREREARAASAAQLLAWARKAGVRLSSDLEEQLGLGFGSAPSGEDRFDAVVGLFGMLNVVLERRPAGDPQDEAVRRIEGWILGQTSS
jgi:hypothetical protein